MTTRHVIPMRLNLTRLIFALWSVLIPSTAFSSAPNIVVIMPDDMGWGDPSFNGGTTPTPHLDRLASKSLILEKFYTFPSCSPTRAAFLSGQFPHRLGIPAPVRPIDPGLPESTLLLPQVLQKAGYRTAMIGKWHLGGESAPAQRPHQRGFDKFYGSYRTGIDYFEHTNTTGELDWWKNEEAVHEEGYITHLQAAAAVDLISDASTEAPLFLFFAPHAPHSPAQAPAETIARFPDAEGPVGPTYAAMISEFDDAVGQILQAIEESGEQDNTIVLFFSDNGGTRFSSRGDFRGQKNTLFQGGIRSQLLVRWPHKIESQQRTDFVASVMDIAPTILAAAGVDPAKIETVDGLNIWPNLMAGTVLNRGPIAIANHEYTAVTPRWKLIQSSEGSELYDLEVDPSETTDVADSHPAVAAELTQFLKDYRKDIPVFEARATRRGGRGSGAGRPGGTGGGRGARPEGQTGRRGQDG